MQKSVIIFAMIIICETGSSMASSEPSKNVEAVMSAAQEAALMAHNDTVSFQMHKLNEELNVLASGGASAPVKFNAETPIPLDKEPPTGFKSVPCCNKRHTQWGPHKHFAPLQ